MSAASAMLTASSIDIDTNISTPRSIAPVLAPHEDSFDGLWFEREHLYHETSCADSARGVRLFRAIGICAIGVAATLTRTLDHEIDSNAARAREQRERMG